MIDAFLNKDLHAPTLDGCDVLEAIEKQQGLLVTRAHNIYSFSHLTLQEFLAAGYFLHTEQTNEIISKYFLDPRWREVFLLLVGIGRGDSLLPQMANALAASVKDQKKVCGLLSWVAGSTKHTKFKDDFETRSAARRAIALFWARAFDGKLNFKSELAMYLDATLDLALNLDPSLDLNKYMLSLRSIMAAKCENVSRSYALDFVKELRNANFLKSSLIDAVEIKFKSKQPNYIESSDNNEWKSEGQEINPNEFKNIFLRAVKYPNEFTDWTNKESKALGKYIYGCNFLLECKQASSTVSVDVWDAIVKNLLTN